MSGAAVTTTAYDQRAAWTQGPPHDEQGDEEVEHWWDGLLAFLTGDDAAEDIANEASTSDDAQPTTDDDAGREASMSGTEHTKLPSSLRIQTLGDSIVDNDLGGARPQVQQLLEGIGVNVQWVGTSNASGPTSLSSRATDAHWGGSIEQMLPKTAQWVKAADPDLVMVSAGGNDVFQGKTAGLAQRWQEYLDTICQAAPGVPIVAATNHQLHTKTKAAENAAIAEHLNPLIVASDDEVAEGGCTVRVVGMAGAISDDMLPDDVHPDEAGYAAMAKRWFPVLREALSDVTTGNDEQHADAEEATPSREDGDEGSNASEPSPSATRSAARSARSVTLASLAHEPSAVQVDAGNVRTPSDGISRVALVEGEMNGYKVRSPLPETDQLTLSYQVRVSSDLHDDGLTTAEMKWPGLAGKPNDESGWYGSSGGTLEPDAFSVRLHTRKSSEDSVGYPHADAYVYAPRAAGQSYRQWGISVPLRGGDGQRLRIPTERWVPVKIQVSTNTAGKDDGGLDVWLDGVHAVSIDDVRWRAAGVDTRWNQVMAETFFNPPGAPQDSYIDIKDFTVSAS
ncbi:GDSL-type esterase/lipase family protein [Kineococcus gypseus]|uniref:GDSL-type esterase/lipase family protein n=1 Tax=Kineococcus gypseus TaxID=1637102 RepID=UPI003D7DE699